MLVMYLLSTRVIWLPNEILIYVYLEITFTVMLVVLW